MTLLVNPDDHEAGKILHDSVGGSSMGPWKGGITKRYGRPDSESEQRFIGKILEQHRGLLRTETDVMAIVESLFRQSRLANSAEVQKLLTMLAKYYVDGMTIEEIIQQVEVARLGQEVKRVSNLRNEHAASQDDEFEEERRLFYVAVTRAEERLYLSWARGRFYAGKDRDCEPSRFLDEIDQRVLENRVSRRKGLHVSSWAQSHIGFNDFASGSRKSGGISGNVRIRKASDFYSAQQGETDDFESVVAGARVRHRKFGDGIVKSTMNSGARKKAVVHFDRAGEKRLFVSQARLEVLN